MNTDIITTEPAFKYHAVPLLMAYELATSLDKLLDKIIGKERMINRLTT